MPEFHARINRLGNGLQFPPKGKELFLEHAKKNAGRMVIIKTILPESEHQRDFYHGAVLPLWAYLDGKDYTDPVVNADYHQLAKLEFNGKIIVTKSGTKKIPESTKGLLNGGFLERVIANLEAQYGIDRALCLDPEHYKDFVARVYLSGGYDDYIKYLVDLKRLPVIHK